MNTTITNNQPFIDPALEVWGARLTGYLSVMGMVILQYDCLLTLKDEVCPIAPRAITSHLFLQVRLVWPGELSLPKLLYYLNRYLSFVAMIFCNYREWYVLQHVEALKIYH